MGLSKIKIFIGEFIYYIFIIFAFIIFGIILLFDNLIPDIINWIKRKWKK